VRASEKAFDEFCQGGYDNSFFVWQWINVEEWFRQFVDGNPAKTRYPLCPQLNSPELMDSTQAIVH